MNISAMMASKVQSTDSSRRGRHKAYTPSTSARPHGSQPRSSAITNATKSVAETASRRGSRGASSGVSRKVMAVRGTSSRQATASQPSITATVGSIIHMKPTKLSPERCQRKRFWGLPMGVSAEPALTASASRITSRASGKCACCASARVSGTSRNRLTSLVTSADSSAADAVSTAARVCSCRVCESSRRAADCSTPLRSTPCVMASRPARAPTVCQSTSRT